MKKLDIEKMEKHAGGYNFVDGCRAYAFAVIVTNGIEFGSVEAYIIGGLPFDFCLYQQ